MAVIHIYLICVLTLDFYLICTVYSTLCKWNEFTVEDESGKLSCSKCPSCPPGRGLSPQCGGKFKQSELKTVCEPCQPGKTYSATNDIGSCQPCGECAKHQTVVRNCTSTSNSKCNKSCSHGFYYEELTGDCQPCSWCCSDGRNEVKSECEDMPYYKQCDANSECKQPKCQEGQYLVATKKGGHCKACSKCSVGQKELIPCNLTSDTICGECDKGFYKDDANNECKPCSACCNDDKDVHVEKCAEQNMPENLQCSYTKRAISECQQKRNASPTHPESKNSLVVFVAAVVAVGIVTLVPAFLYWRLKYRKYKRLSTSQSVALLLQYEETPIATKEDPGATLEDPTANGSQESLSFEKSGVMLQFTDADSFFNDARGIRLEICWDKGAVPTLQDHEVQLSPVIKFHPHGLKLTKPVQVRIPHSALVFYSHGWNIKLKGSTFQNGKIVWKDQEMDEICNNEVSFYVDCLLSYVVFGMSVYDSKPTKKRFQCAVFGGEGKVGENYTAYLYVFDDCEAPLEKIMQEEKSKNRILLGSLQSLYVETVLDTDIKITIKQPVEGWKIGHIHPQVITHQSLKESYQTVPRSEILFEHDDGRNRDFFCTFELTADSTTTKISAVASIKEDPFRKYQYQESCSGLGPNHRMVTGRSLCDPLITSDDKPSPCFHELPQEVLHAVCMKLDLSLRGVGNWRHVAANLGFTDKEIEVFREEMLTPDGSPCTVMLQALQTKSPKLTVAEFVQILQMRKIQRFDVVDILEPFVYELVP